MLGVVFLAISLSLDSLVIGVTYKIRNIKIPVFAKIIIASVSALITLASIQIGQWICRLISEQALGLIGVGIIIIMGVRIIVNDTDEQDCINYDKDHSEYIEPKEALLLGTVLSIDSLSAGIAIAMMGGQIYLLPLLVGGMNVSFLWIGEKIMFGAGRCSKLAGIILILVGLSRLLVL